MGIGQPIILLGTFSCLSVIGRVSKEDPCCYVRVMSSLSFFVHLGKSTANEFHDSKMGFRVKGECRLSFLARNKARVLIEQLVVLSIHLSRHNILSTYDGDHICWHVMFRHRIE